MEGKLQNAPMREVDCILFTAMKMTRRSRRPLDEVFKRDICYLTDLNSAI